MASCCICYSVFKSNDLLTATECGHVFHQTCIHTWLSTGSHQTCPNCRRLVARGLLRRLHLNFDEETTQNNSMVQELQKNNISIIDKLKKMEQKKITAEKKCITLLKSKETYQQRVANLREDNIELKETIKDLKRKLGEERKQHKFYEHEYLALSAQIDEMQNNW